MPENKLLVLGGTGEAAELARRATEFFGPGLKIIVSYSGISGQQPDLPCEIRVGGFGGAQGLIEYMEENAITHLIDATHPFAENISQHAYIAANALNVPAVVLCREEWKPGIRDRWLDVDDMADAVRTVAEMKVRTVLTIGIKELAQFSSLDDVSFVARVLQAPKEPLGFKDCEFVEGRPPFTLEEERQLLRDKKIRLMVCKNSGGEATRAKLDAAREEGVAVLMVRRPFPEPMEYLATAAQAIQWLTDHGA